jgi:hypothetical protein
VEKVDGTQMRLKLSCTINNQELCTSGKGGWDSDEIETTIKRGIMEATVYRGKGGWDSDEIETVPIGKLMAGVKLLWKRWMGLR